MAGNFATFPLLAALAFIVAACNQTSPVSERNAEPAARPSTSTHREFGDYTVHFNAVSTDQLTAPIAQRYNLVRSRNRALLTVSVLAAQPDAPPKAVRAAVQASAVNLNGQLKGLTMREVEEGTAVYYIGEVGVSHGETLVFTIGVTPAGAAESYSVRYMRQFFAD